MWDIRDTNTKIKRRHNKLYKRKIHSNKVEYSTDAVTYWTTHDVKVSLIMLEFSSSKIILHHFHDNNNEGELGVYYDIIIGRDLMV